MKLPLVSRRRVRDLAELVALYNRLASEHLGEYKRRARRAERHREQLLTRLEEVTAQRDEARDRARELDREKHKEHNGRANALTRLHHCEEIKKRALAQRDAARAREAAVRRRVEELGKSPHPVHQDVHDELRGLLGSPGEDEDAGPGG